MTDADDRPKAVQRTPSAPRRSGAILAVFTAILEIVIAILANQIQGLPYRLAMWALILLVLVLAVITYVGHSRSVELRGRKLFSWKVLAAILAIVLIAGQAFTLVTLMNKQADKCPFPAGGGVVSPFPSRTEGLHFCPVRINAGALPITGPFQLEGKVVGAPEDRSQILLLSIPDAKTCDALGNPGTGGAILVAGAHVGSSDGTWKTEDRLGYPEAVTIRRTYEYVAGLQSTLTAIMEDRKKWRREGHDDNSYPGIMALPPDVQILSRFEVAPGTYEGRVKPCKARK